MARDLRTFAPGAANRPMSRPEGAPMSAVIADPAADAVPVKRGKKKLIIFGAAGVVLAIALAGGAAVFMKQRAAHAAAAAEAGDDDGVAGDHATATKIDPKNAPVYLPLDPFVVNLADKEADRYAQIGVTFELSQGSSAEELKAYMPSIRNAVLLILANKTSRELNDRAGKEQLAREILREAVRPMGIEIAAPEPVGTAASDSEGGAAHGEPASAVAVAVAGAGASAAGAKTKPKARHAAQKNPIHLVHFSSFIIQ